jgi:hypothetical protein
VRPQMVPQRRRPPETGAVGSFLDRQPFKDEKEYRDQQSRNLECDVRRRQASLTKMAAQGAVGDPGPAGSLFHGHSGLVGKAGDDEPEDIRGQRAEARDDLIRCLSDVARGIRGRHDSAW